MQIKIVELIMHLCFTGDRSKEGQVKPSKAEKKDRLGEFNQSLKDSGDKNEPAEFQSKVY